MTSEDTKASLEEQIAEEREALTDRLKAFSDQFSADSLLQSVSDRISRDGGDIAEQLVDGVRRNPIAAGLIGAGLTWLLIDRVRGDAVSEPQTQRTARAPGINDAAFEPEFSERLDAATSDPDEAPATAAQKMKQRAEDMRDRLYEGTADLSDIARARVIAAREKALLAQQHLERATRQTRDKSADLMNNQPLMIGAGAFLAGAAVAYCLPRTETENQAFGAKRDALVAEADAIFTEEIERAKAVGAATLAEVTDTAHETIERVPTGDEAISSAQGKVAAFSERVKTKAKRDRAS